MANLKAVLIYFLLSGSFFLYSHHAMEYIEMESYSTARRGEMIFHLHFDYMVDDFSDSSLDHWEYTPGLSIGITDRLMIDVHTHYAGFGAGHINNIQTDNDNLSGLSPFIEAAAFSIQYRITEGRSVNFAMAAAYEVPFQRSKEVLGGKEVFEGMLIGAYEFGNHSNMTINITAGYEGSEFYTEWAFGVKTALTTDPHGIAGGLEFFGGFSGGVSVLAGVYFPLGSENIIFKTGLEFSSGSSRANTTMMYRF